MSSRFLGVDFVTIWPPGETNGCLEGRKKNTLSDPNHYDMFWKMVDSNVRHAWFMAKEMPVGSFKKKKRNSPLIFSLRTRRFRLPEAAPGVMRRLRWPSHRAPKASEEPLSTAGLSEGHIKITSVCGLVVNEPQEQCRKDFLLLPTPPHSPLNVGSY